MRELNIIIDDMLKVIPKTKKGLIHRLSDIQTSVLFASPEMIPFWWNECADVLNSEISNLNEGWHFKLQEIFSGNKSISDIVETKDMPEDLDRAKENK